MVVTALQAEEVRRMREGGLRPREVAEATGLGLRVVADILSGRTAGRPLSARERFLEDGRTGRWAPACMDAEEWADWRRTNPIGLTDAVARPCEDCLLGFAADMRAEGHCNGTPGGAAVDEIEEEPAPRPLDTHPAHRLERAAARALAPVEDAPVTTPTAPPVIPCAACLHEPVCALKRELPADPSTLAQPSILGPGLWLVPSSVTIRCDHLLLARVSPVRPSVTTRHPGKAGEELEKAKRAADALVALDRHNGDQRAAAAELGIRGQAFAMIVKYAKREAATS